MKKRNQTAPRRLSNADLRDVKGGLLPRVNEFDVHVREVRNTSNRLIIGRRIVAR